MRHNVVVSKSRDDWYSKVLGWILFILVVAKDLGELLHHELVLGDDLVLGARQLLVIVVPRGVTGPDDKIDVIGYVVLDPVHGGVDEGDG